MFKDGGCKVFHGDKGLIMSTIIFANMMFVASAHVVLPMCIKVSTENVTHL